MTATRSYFLKGSVHSCQGRALGTALCCNAIAQIAAVTEDTDGDEEQQQQQQQQQFDVYVKTPRRAGMRAAPEEASVNEADTLSPAAALQKFVDWALKQHRQHAGQEADPSRLVLVSHYGFCYAFSILVQQAERYGVQLPPVRLADSCLWTKATCGARAGAKLYDLADQLLCNGAAGYFEHEMRTDLHYALADAWVMSRVVPLLHAQNSSQHAAAAAVAAAGSSFGESGGWKRQLLALSTPLRHFVGRLGLAPDGVVHG
uniref:Uncharacterized protein n=1 Tax=Tetradesmus obliquus TaxID=3088 RepID=A0A383V695_TETOB|eukprot:jgi/Sobl393_1/14000/SZX61118.1